MHNSQLTWHALRHYHLPDWNNTERRTNYAMANPWGGFDVKTGTPQPEILVAEDDLSDEHLLKWAFTNAGLTRPLQFVHNGAEAMDYLLGVPPFDDRAHYPFPDLLVLDWRMPRVDGCELLSWLQKVPRLDQLRVAVMSGASWEQDFEQARYMGASLFLNKWHEFSELVQAIKELIGGTTAHQRCGAGDSSLRLSEI